MTTQAQTAWVTLSALAAWALGVGAGALNFDVKLDFDDDIAERLNVYVIAATAIVFGIITIAVSRVSQRHVRRAWTTLAVLGVIIATILFPIYLDRRSEWSCLYAAQTRIAIGAKLTQFAATHVASTGRVLSPCKIIEDFAGDLDAVWPRTERVNRQRLLAAFSYGAALSLAIAVFAIGQAVGHDSARPNASP